MFCGTLGFRGTAVEEYCSTLTRFSGETFCLRFFSANFHPSVVARGKKPIKFISKSLFRKCKQHQILLKTQTVDLATDNGDIPVGKNSSGDINWITHIL